MDPGQVSLWGPRTPCNPNVNVSTTPSIVCVLVCVFLGTGSSFYLISKGLCVQWRSHPKECSGFKGGCGGQWEGVG